jgi:hypothetical protein
LPVHAKREVENGTYALIRQLTINGDSKTANPQGVARNHTLSHHCRL